MTPVVLPEPSLFTSPSSLASGSESLFLGSQDGQVHILSSSFKLIRSFSAYEGLSITHMKQIDGTALLVTIAEDLSSDPQLKVWALDNIEKKTGTPKCLSSLEISNNKKQFPISAFAALDDLSQLAVGFANGTVSVVRGDLIHDRGAKQRIVFESEEPITGVEFREGSNTTVLYVATTGRILTLTISGRGQGRPARPLEDIGCDVGCMTIDKESREIVVVRNDRVYYYGLNGRGPSYAYEGPKKLVKTFKNYVAVVSAPQATNSKRFLSSDSGAFNTSRFSILDLDLQYVAHTEALTSEVQTAFTEWGDLFLLARDGKVYRYHEKTLQQKLEIFTQRNLYVLAINFAQKFNLDVAQRNVILRRYGDYLYKKGDFDTAMQQYLKAIDNTEPSQVIRKYLDTQRIHNLIEYLEELHEHDKATLDHTTLLLNCYAKLKDTKKLEDFINSGYNFDFDTAIAMCRQGGYYDQAVFLARKHNEHEIVVDVLIEDSGKYHEALDYIWRLDPESAYPNLAKYARVLLEHCSKEATQIFIDFYTGQFRPRKDQPAINATATPTTGGLATFANYIPLPYRQKELASPATVGNQSIDGQIAESVSTEPILEYKIPKPRTAFSAFVDHPAEFITFLEACLNQENMDDSDKTDLYTALFEMYLEMASQKASAEKGDWEGKARRLIDNKQVSCCEDIITPLTHQIPIDTSNVLLLSHLSSYHDGTILVREREGLRFDIFRSYTSAHDTSGAIKALRKHGPEEPALYPAALTYFTSSAKILEEAGSEVEAVLKKIDTDGLMAPLQVIQTLSASGVAKMGLVKKYLMETISRERKEIDSNRQTATTYRSATANKRDELSDLTSKPTVFQARRCSLCGASLDLPTVHFLCHHSFHQRCLNTPSSRSRSYGFDVEAEVEEEEAEAQCPICEKDNETIKAIRKSQLEHASKHDLFLDALGRSRDGMATVGEWFGRGVMDVGVVNTD